jgi:Uncharacterized protein conserved in bacteria
VLAMVNPKLKDDLNDQLCRAVLELENVEECYQFFEDICTVSEIKALSRKAGSRKNAASRTYV